MNARSAAAGILCAVTGDGRSLSAALSVPLATLPVTERALTQELCYGVLRFYPRLCFIAAQILNKPLKRKDQDVQQLILIGLYQLIYLKVPAHAAVAETVAATRLLGKDWASGLVNALLRSFQRGAQQLLAKADDDAVALYAHPDWWLEQLREDWPEYWRDMLVANNQRPPMTLRVNALRGSRDDYAQTLQAAGIIAHPDPHAPHALTLEKPVDVTLLPGFSDGVVSVQDAAAQLAAPLLQLAPGLRVLDACAAPGGKTAHLLESEPQLHVLALDSDAQRLTRVQEALARLHLNAESQQGDAGCPQDWWDGKPFDRILLDAPCSGSGVIRRHPDIKLLRTAQDSIALAERQQTLLDALWPLLAQGAILLYATCSILMVENQHNLTRFLETHSDARELAIVAQWGHAQTPGRQILPGENGMDGFYYARLMKL